VFAYIAAQLPALLRAELSRAPGLARAALALARIAALALARIAAQRPFALRLERAFLLEATRPLAIERLRQRREAGAQGNEKARK
jgi:hypothetical protein